MTTDSNIGSTGKNEEKESDGHIYKDKVQYEIYSGCIKAEEEFTKTEMNNEWNINFLKIVT